MQELERICFDTAVHEKKLARVLYERHDSSLIPPLAEWFKDGSRIPPLPHQEGQHIWDIKKKRSSQMYSDRDRYSVNV